MARLFKTFGAQTAASLVTTVNAFLATLVNPTIVDLEFVLARNALRNGDDYRLTLRYNSGGAALATPFLIRIDEASILVSAETTLQAFLTANAGFFFGDTLFGFIDDGGVKLSKAALLTVYNVTSGASANYMPPAVSAAPVVGRVYPNAIQTFVNGVDTLIEWPVTDFVTGGMTFTYTPGVDGFFTVPVAGQYLLDGLLNWETNAGWVTNDSVAMHIYINGGFFGSFTYRSLGDTELVAFQLRGTELLNLLAGDTVALYGQVGTVDTLTRDTNPNVGLSHFILSKQ